MADESLLPKLPLTPTDDLFLSNPRPEKRVRIHNSSPPISSDPPFFSSDDDPSAENYLGSNGRQKRKFRGPWYNQEPDNSGERKPKRTLQRKFDSGIWLGSDSTEDEDDAEFASRVHTPDLFNQRQTLVSRIGEIGRRELQIAKPPPSPEEMAEEKIGLCLEAGREEIDLSNCELTHLSNATIKPLSTIVSIPMGSQGLSYHPLRPKLKLFLFSNNLKHVPGEIFNLDNVTVLSLRSNTLVELPSAIGKLRRLVELNIANNYLHFLPYEILQIFSEPSKLHSLTWHPNPFYEPDIPEASPYKGDEPYPPDLRDGVLSRSGRPGAVSSGLPETSLKWNVKYKYRSDVRFMNIDGTLAKGPNFPGHGSLFSNSTRQRNCTSLPYGPGRSMMIKIAPPGDVPGPPRVSSYLSGDRASKAPSLLEVALQAWSQSSGIPDFRDWLGEEPPERLAHIMEDARVLQEMEADSRKCTICKRRFVIPRTEWLEWWQISKAQKNKLMASAASPLRLMENRRDQVESLSHAVGGDPAQAPTILNYSHQLYQNTFPDTLPKFVDPRAVWLPTAFETRSLGPQVHDSDQANKPADYTSSITRGSQQSFYTSERELSHTKANPRVGQIEAFTTNEVPSVDTTSAANEESNDGEKSALNEKHISASCINSDVFSRHSESRAASPSLSTSSSSSQCPLKSCLIPNCPRTFIHNHKYNRHLKSHLHPASCPYCTRGFETTKDVNRHINDVHQTTKKYFCTMEGCQYAREGGRGFPRKENWKRHLRRH